MIPASKTTAHNDSILAKVTVLMDAGDFENAQQILLKSLDESKSQSNQYDQYFLHTYLAEVMYYTALNEQGLQNAVKALKISQSINNDTLIGNAHNLLGLIHLNRERLDSAKTHFEKALKLLSPKLNVQGLSRYDHVLSNLAETYLYLKQPDQSIKLSREAMRYSIVLKVPRAEILNHWTLGEAFVLQNKLDSAYHHFNLGMQNPYLKNAPDVQMFLYEGLIKTAASAGDLVLLGNLETQSVAFAESHKNYDFAITQYYSAVVNAFLKIGDYRKASSYQQKLNSLKDNIRFKREELHVRLLNSYYKKEQELAVGLAIKSQQEKEIELNHRILIILGFLLVVLSLLFLFFRRWITQKRKFERLQFQHEKVEILKAQELEKLQERFAAIEEERNRIARELHDDIGSSLSSVSIFADLASREFDKDPNKALELIFRVKSKTQEISENISDLIWSIYSRNDSWGNLIDRIKNFCFEVLTSKGVEVVISDDYRLHDLEISILYKKNLLLFLKEAVNNISKYANATHVEILMKLENDQILISIHDNGIGFDPKSKTSGNGLAGFHARATAIDGSVTIDSAVGKGTRILLSFKIELPKL
jgi:signal transduction histidine kinase